MGSTLVGGIAIWANNGESAPAATQPPAPASPFDRAAFDAYWAGPVVRDEYRAMVKSVDWSGGVLVAHTSLFADSDAVEPAKAICVALSMFWAGTPQGFEPVRVVDRVDEVLVSRRTVGDTCTWRR